MAFLDQHAVPAGPIYKVDEMFDDPQVQHLKMTPEVHHHARGDIKVVGQPLTLERTPASLTCASLDAGEHTDEILKEAEFDEEAIRRLRAGAVV